MGWIKTKPLHTSDAVSYYLLTTKTQVTDHHKHKVRFNTRPQVQPTV